MTWLTMSAGSNEKLHVGHLLRETLAQRFLERLRIDAGVGLRAALAERPLPGRRSRDRSG